MPIFSDFTCISWFLNVFTVISNVILIISSQKKYFLHSSKFSPILFIFKLLQPIFLTNWCLRRAPSLKTPGSTRVPHCRFSVELENIQKNGKKQFSDTDRQKPISYSCSTPKKKKKHIIKKKISYVLLIKLYQIGCYGWHM